MRFEYRIARARACEPIDIEEAGLKIRQHGMDGWRVTCCVATEGWVLWTLEREVK